MNALRRLSTGHHRFFLALVVLALAARALVPSGWMVAPGADGVPRLALCSGAGVIDLKADADADADADAGAAAAMAKAMPGMHHDGHDGAPSHPDHPCAFVGAALASTLPVVDLPVHRAPLAAPAPRLRGLAVAIGRGLAAPPPPQTGPPAFA